MGSRLADVERQSVRRSQDTTASPIIEIRFSPLYAWLLVGFGVVFFLLGLWIASPLIARQNVGFGLFLAVLAVAAIVGGNYWRHHLHVVARLTPRQLFLRRAGTVSWTEIAAIEKREVRARYKGAAHGSEYICIKLKTGRPVQKGLEGFMLKLKADVTGYDIIIPGYELSRPADWFIAECQKRMSASGTATT
jgi:hypothetical protein